MAPFDVEPDRPIEEILSQIKAGAIEGAQSQSRTSAYAIGPFSALLVRLSRDAERTARTVRRLTRAIVVLTVMLLMLTGVLVWLTWVLVQEDYSSQDSDGANAQTTRFQVQPVEQRNEVQTIE